MRNIELRSTTFTGSNQENGEITRGVPVFLVEKWNMDEHGAIGAVVLEEMYMFA